MYPALKKLIVKGGARLTGSVDIGGAKNAAVAIIPATVLGEGVSVIRNIPNISDVTQELKMLETMGAKVRLIGRRAVEIDTTTITTPCVPYELAKKLRAGYYFLGSLLGRMGIASVSMPGGCSFGVRPITITTPCVPYELAKKLRAGYYFLGSLLGRMGIASVSMPGGCSFGVRPIDQHIKGFEAMGVTVEIVNGMINAETDRLEGAHIYFDMVSVGATMNIMLAACRARGLTILENVAKEPHIVDLANYLNSMGADIRGAGTDIIKIHGVSSMHGADYTIIPDQIEAGTYMTAVAATGGDALIKNIIPKHLESIIAKLRAAGAVIEEYDDYLRIYREGEMNSINVTTMPHPGFPTDMQPQIATMLLGARGTSIITEGVWDNRFKYTEQLSRFGAKITVDGKIAVINGGVPLSAAPVRATDLRGGAAMIIAGLMSEGITEIEETIHIERGYEDIVEKFVGLGADIRFIEVPDATNSVASVG